MVGHRYYNPEWGRWIQPDDIEYLDPQSINGLNLYAYCNNDPVNKYDPSGHIAISALIISTVVGAVLGGVYGGISAALNGQDVDKGILIGALTGGLTGAFAMIESVPVVLLSTFVIGAAGDVASQIYLEEKNFLEVNLVQSISAGVTNSVLTGWSNALSCLGNKARLNNISSSIFATLTNGPIFAFGMLANMELPKKLPNYTIEDLITYKNKTKTLIWGG